MSTLTNSASNNNNNNHHHLLHHHQHHQLSSSPQGPTGAAAPSFLATTTSSPSSGSTSINNNHVPAADCNSNLINNNNSSSSSSNHHPPATTATAGAATTAAATPPTPTSSGGGGGGGGYSGVVSGILGVREVSAKLFLPFARTMMPSSHGGGGSSSSSNNTPTDATNGGAGGDGGHPATPAAGSGTPIQQQQQPQQHQHHAQHHNQQQLILPESLNIVLHGYQRKLKTNRKKYFVVYGDTPDKCARLEYFDSEKKFKQSIAAVHASSLAAGGGSAGSSASGAPVAKRSIALRSCFNINKRHDTKKHIIALFTKDDCFCIVFESEDELYRWLRTLLKLQRGEESEGDPPRPTFEHVWDVYVQRKGLGDSYGILGNYRLCITDKILSLVRIGPAMTATGDQRVEVVEFSLASIRRCGASQRYFYLEVGRSSKTGAGEIWMEVQDSIIAQNMHTTIMKSAKNKDDNNLGPMIRIRSSSANAASKPSMLMRRPTHSGQKPINCSPSSEDQSKLRAQSTDAQNSESSSSAASITTVVLAGSPSCTTSRATAPNPNLDPNSEKPLDGPTATAALTCNSTFTSTCTTTSTTTATIITTSTPTTTATTSAATLTAAITTGVHTSSVAPAVSPITIVPLSGPLNAVAAAAGASVVPSSASLFQVGHCSSATGTRHSVAIHSSSSSLASIGSCSPTDGYIPLIPSASIGTGGGGGVGGGTVSGRGVSGSPRLGVTAHSPGPPIAGGGYRRPSFVKQHSQQSQQQQQQRHYQPPSGVASLPPSSSAHHQHPHPSSTTHHHHQHLHHPHHQHHNQQQQQQQKHHHPPVALASQAASTATAVPVLPAASTATHSVAGTGLVQHTPTAASIASCSSSSSSGTSAVTTELLSSSSSSSSSSSTTTTTTTAPDHGVAIARERCDSLPSRNRTTSETMPHHQQLQHQLQQQHQQQQQHYQQHQQLIQNSGGMPPPRMIPSNRPHSMHISSSHSPPVNSSPLSPPPGGGSATTTGAYSTGSDGSSLSIDESTDSFMTGSLTPDEGNGFSKVINQLNSGGSIPEENSEEFIKDYSHIDMRTGGVGGAGGSSALSHHDDYGVQNHHYAARHGHLNSLSLPISQGALARRGGSPAPPSTVGSVEGSAYMEMCSPSGSSPGDPSGSCYMAMSPVADYSRGLCSSSSAHSRASSLAEDLVDGYVPMTMPRGPQSTSSAAAAATAANQPEEYMNMDPTVNGAGAVGPPCHAALSSRHMNSVIGIGGMSSAASSCSITSGTPSTDLRLSLEKVSAYIAQSGDDCEMNDRPHRTYSVGSRPEHNKRKLRPDILNTSDGFGGNGATNARARAFSVGSRAKVPRSDGVRGYGNAAAAIIVPFLSANESNNNSSSSISNAGSSYTSAGGGSNSLMMMMHLDEAAGGSSGGGLGKKSSSGSLLPDGTKPPGHGSFDRMGDLMEIDYSVPPNRPQANGASSGASSSSTPLKGKPSSSQDALISGGAMPGMEDYLDMTGTNYSNNNNNNNNHGHHHHHHQEVEDDRRAAIVNAHAVAGYVEMHPGRTNSQSTEPEGDYLNMTPGAGAAAGFDVPDAPSGAYGGASTSTALSPKSTSSPIQITHSPKKFSTPVAGPVAGSSGGGGSAGKNNNYLEMYPRAWSNRAAPAAPRIATKVPSSEDYLNMTPLMMSAADSGSEERISDVPPSGGPTGATIASAATTRTAPMVESSSAPDGYMEMWPHNHPNHHNTSAAATATATVPASDDYMNMSCGAASSSSGGEDRLTSAPITIQPTPGKCRLDLSEEPKGDGRGQGGSGLPNYLPLGQNPDSARINATACLQQAQQQQAATTVQAQGTIQTTTGQQSGWVGFSPSKANPLRARCDSRDSGIVTPSGSQATIFPFSPGSPTKPFPGAAGGSATAKEPLEDLSQNYAELSLSKKAAGGGAGGTGPDPSSSSNSSSTNASNRRTSTGNRTAPLAEPEYVNFWPPGGGRTTSNPTTPTDIGTPTPLATARSRSIVDEDVAGDYALMNPAATSSRKPSTSSMGSSTFGGSGIIPTTLANAVTPAASDSGSTTPPALVVKKSIAFLANNQMGFKPIASSQDTDLLRSSATVVAQRPNFGRQLSEWRVISAEPMEATAGGSSSTMAARPNSVNSEMIGASRGASAAGGSSMAGGSSGNVPGGYASGATRPSSANSERLLPIISATSSSASSTSTLCESKNQSPSASCTTIATVAGPRPDSVSSITDPHIISRPPSVSSERELHYASLDLPPCTSKTPGSTAVAVTSPTVQKMDIDDSPLGVGNDSRSSLDSNTSIPSPPSSASLQQQQQQQSVRNSTFSYAQIDFLRTAPLAQKQQQQPQPQSPHPSPSPMNPGADSNDTGASSA
ncbi:pneumococcal serine-rich repeat protein-like isoform X4 [Anopheles albimanus]|uniref:pneumococcal serine-rich repeat protein-like isoform X4 n=1 Tax=Anopheles albimanus TaxID=7167 RepID=UPI00163DF0D0|nr:pneumococcal serine-rich repeat protein-like isoform X4 [Anopheles albimanus]